MLSTLEKIELQRITNITIIGISAGYMLNSLLMIPGASAYIKGIYYPYAKHDTLDFCSKEPDKFVSAEIIHDILDHQDVNTLVITAAMPTNRVRRGDNQAYIGFTREGKRSVYQLVLQKEADENIGANYLLRITYDSLISTISMKLFLGEQVNLSEHPRVTNLTKVY